jgi:hypothetical protein
MPVITQLLTDSEYTLLRHLLGEDSFFDRGSPHPVALLKRDIDMARRAKQISQRLSSNGDSGAIRNRTVDQLSEEFGLAVRTVWKILKRLEGRSNGHKKTLKFYVTDFVAAQG